MRDFVLEQANQAAIERICHLVGGMPLGIELAATWVSTLNNGALFCCSSLVLPFYLH